MSYQGGQNFQPESLSELARFVQYMFTGFEKSLTNMADKLDKMDVVSREQYREDMEMIRGEVKELEKEIDANRIKQANDLENFQAKLTNQNRWLIGSLLFPLVGVLLTIYSLFQGGA